MTNRLLTVTLTNFRSNTLIGASYVFIAYFLYSISDAAAKWLVVDMSVWQILFIRSAMALLICVSVMGWRSLGDLFSRPFRWEIIIMNLANFAGWVSYYSAAKHMPLSQLYCMYYLSPIITTLLAGLLLKEQISARHWLATLLGFSGVLVVVKPSGAWPALIPILLGLCTAFFWAFASVLYRRNVAKNDNWGLINGFNTIMALMCALPVANSWQHVTLHHWTALLIVGISGIAAHFLYLSGIRRIPVSVAGPISFSSLLWSIGLGYLIFGDIPEPRMFIGAALIIISGLIIVYGLNKTHAEEFLTSHVEEMSETTK